MLPGQLKVGRRCWATPTTIWSTPQAESSCRSMRRWHCSVTALAARRMLEHVGQFGIHPQNLAADKAYGSGKFLAWLLARNTQTHIPVIDGRHQTKGHFTREHFRYEQKENAYYCPEGKALRYRSQARGSRGNVYCST